MMNTKQFTENPGVFHLVSNLLKEGFDKKEYSDVLDEAGHQYVELVMEGGGVLGVALIGYNYVLEQMGLRFFSVAGTSAGSINALLLAGMGDVSKPKAEKLVDVLANKDLMEFVDGDKDAKDFVNALVKKAGIVKMIVKGSQVIDNLKKDFGLNPGNDFLNWLTEILKNNNIKTTADLERLFGVVPPGLTIRKKVDNTIKGLKPRFCVIASDLTTETKVEFPDMGSLYWEKPDEVPPAYYVRSSMSVPYFFHPFVIKNLPQGGPAMERWKTLVKYEGPIPEAVYFVDGGLMSNFPIDVFHNKSVVPRLPTFGVRLGVSRNEPNKISSPISLFGAMFNSIRHLHDYDFILKNPDYEMLVEKIDIGDHDWLNFGIDDKSKIDLFLRGAQAADRFLRRFNWEKYKNVRELVKSLEVDLKDAKKEGTI
jgi:NTE family protein